MQRFNTGLEHFKTKTVSSVESQEGSSSRKDLEFVRVTDVILSLNRPEVKLLGGNQALYGVFYQPLFVTAEEEFKSDINWRFAYCGLETVRQIPIKGEIVKVERRPAVASSEEDFNSDGDVEKLYWTGIVPVWNHPHLNIYPDVKALKGPVDLGKNFKENDSIKPLQLNEGDVTLEGRYGQSLRFGGTSSGMKSIASDSSGKPYTILRNGQAAVSGDTCFEDVNEDDSSLYLVSDHRIPIREANRKYKGAKDIPTLAAQFKGKQAVLNSDRLVLNARKDRLIMAAKDHASLNAKSVSIDGNDYVGVDAPEVFLGAGAKLKMEPVLKGTQSTTFLKSLCEILSGWLTSFPAGVPITPWETVTSTSATTTAQLINGLAASLDNLKSTKVYTE